MFDREKLSRGKAVAGIVFGALVLLSVAASSWAGESSNRASANAAGFHLTVLDVKPPTSEQWIVSGFAPGVGSFSQSVRNSDINIDYSDGKASVDTNVLTSLGLTISIKVNWTATTSQLTQYVSIPNPSRTLTINFKRASVSGTVGTFTIGAGTTGAIGQRTVTP